VNRKWTVLALLLVTLVTMFGFPALAQDNNTLIQPAASVTLETPARALVMTPEGQYVYAIEDGSGLLLGFSFDRMSGALNPIEGFPLDLSGISFQPAALAVDPSGSALYVAHEGFVGRSLLTPITVLHIDATSGALTQQDQFSVPSQSGKLNAISVSSGGMLITFADAGSSTLQVVRYTRPAVLPPAPVEVKTLTLQPYRAFCTGVGPSLCYVTETDGQQTLMYNEIEGFTFEWGTTYELRVRVEPVANPPADSSSLRYVLEEVISAEPAPADFTFEISLPPMVITANGDGTFTFLGEQRFGCQPAMCAEIESLLSGTANIDLVMRFPETAGDPLLARLKLER
jgi:6-phosphogluconolactonase (cycloisomerase 2 family)